MLLKVTLSDDDVAIVDRLRGGLPRATWVRELVRSAGGASVALEGSGASGVDVVPGRAVAPTGAPREVPVAEIADGLRGSPARRVARVVPGVRPASEVPQRRQAVPGPDVTNIRSSAQAKRRARPAVPKRKGRS